MNPTPPWLSPSKQHIKTPHTHSFDDLPVLIGAPLEGPQTIRSIHPLYAPPAPNLYNYEQQSLELLPACILPTSTPQNHYHDEQQSLELLSTSPPPHPYDHSQLELLPSFILPTSTPQYDYHYEQQSLELLPTCILPPSLPTTTSSLPNCVETNNMTPSPTTSPTPTIALHSNTPAPNNETTPHPPPKQPLAPTNRDRQHTPSPPREMTLTLNLAGEKIDPKAFQSPLLKNRLTHLNLSNTTLSTQMLHHLCSLSFPLKSLYINNTPIDDKAFQQLTAFPLLQQLSASETQITDKSLSTISSFRTLKSLDISYTEITEAGLRQLFHLEQLSALYLGGSNVKDINVLKFFVYLDTLDLSRLPLRDEQLSILSRLTRLTKINLSENYYFTQRLFTQLDPLSPTELDLHSTNTTDESLKTLQRFETIEKLDLRATPITDAGIEYLMYWQHLSFVDLRDTSISKATITKLKNSYPKQFQLLSSFDPPDPQPQ